MPRSVCVCAMPAPSLLLRMKVVASIASWVCLSGLPFGLGPPFGPKVGYLIGPRMDEGYSERPIRCSSGKPDPEDESESLI